MQKLDPGIGPNLGASQAGGWRGTKIWEAADGGRAGGLAAFDAYRPSRGRALTLAALGQR